MGAAFWLLFVIQIVLLVVICKHIFKVEKETPAETIIPAGDQDVEIF